jgi:hypothetical protein
MKRYLFIAAIALSALGISDVHASAENNDYPTVEGRSWPNEVYETPRKTRVALLYHAYRIYAYVKYCHDSREGYLATYVNGVELARARLKIEAIEAEALAVINSPENKATDNGAELDTKRLFTRAVESLNASTG